MTNVPKRRQKFNTLLASGGVYSGQLPPPLLHSANPTNRTVLDLETPYGQHVVIAHEPDGEHYWTASNCARCGAEFFMKVPSGHVVVGDYCQKHARRSKAYPSDPPEWVMEQLAMIRDDK